MGVGLPATETTNREGGAPSGGRIRERAQTPSAASFLAAAVAGASAWVKRRRPGRRMRRPGIAASLVAFLLTLVAIQRGAIDAWPVNGAASANELIALTNGARQRSGLPAIAQDRRLDAVASARSQDMLDRNYFSHHIPPGNQTVADLLHREGIPFLSVAENIEFNTALAFATVDFAANDFMSSPAHRANILDPRWDRIGVGVAQNGEAKMFTVVFMRAAASTRGIAADFQGRIRDGG